MSELNNYQVRELNPAELLKVEGGLLMAGPSTLAKGLAFAAGFIVGFIDELAS